MELAAKIWWRALVTYFLLNLPALFMPAIFMISVGLAVICGLPALLLFSPVPGLLRSGCHGRPMFSFALIGSIGMPLCYEATYLACYIMKDGWQTPHQAMKEWLLFPVAAWFSALLSIVTHYRSIVQYFSKPSLAA